MPSARIERATLIVLVVLSLVLLAMVIYPFASALFVAAVLAAALTPWTERLAARLRGRRQLAAGIVTLGALLLLVVPIAAVALSLGKEAVAGIGYVKETVGGAARARPRARADGGVPQGDGGRARLDGGDGGHPGPGGPRRLPRRGRAPRHVLHLRHVRDGVRPRGGRRRRGPGRGGARLLPGAHRPRSVPRRLGATGGRPVRQRRQAVPDPRGRVDPWGRGVLRAARRPGRLRPHRPAPRAAGRRLLPLRGQDRPARIPPRGLIVFGRGPSCSGRGARPPVTVCSLSRFVLCGLRAVLCGLCVQGQRGQPSLRHSSSVFRKRVGASGRKRWPSQAWTVHASRGGSSRIRL